MLKNIRQRMPLAIKLKENTTQINKEQTMSNKNHLPLLRKLCLLITFLLLPLTLTYGSVFLFQEPESNIRPVIQGIQQAKSSIKMTMYMITHGSIIDALADSAQRGVNVQVMLEQNPFKANTAPGTDYTPQQTFDKLNAAGVHVKWTNPAYALTHQKSMVIDHNRAFIMTLNMSHSAFTKNREYGVIDSDPQDVAEIERVFDADWLYKKVPVSNPRLLWSPINSRDKIEGLLSDAQHQIFIEAEELQDSAIETLLIKKASAGLDVRVIMPTTEPLTLDQRALRAGFVKLRFLDPQKGQDFIHAKLILVDGQSAYLGSENFSTASLDYNRELGILINKSRGYQEKDILSMLTNIFLTDWNNAAP